MRGNQINLHWLEMIPNSRGLVVNHLLDQTMQLLKAIPLSFSGACAQGTKLIERSEPVHEPKGSISLHDRFPLELSIIRSYTYREIVARGHACMHMHAVHSYGWRNASVCTTAYNHD